jgi:hypothetical protein
MRGALFGAVLILGACASTSSPPPQPSVTVNWSPVTTLSDGSALTDLSGYLITYGPQSGGAALQKTVTGPPAVLTVAAGAYSFSVAAVSVSHGVGIPATVTHTVP